MNATIFDAADLGKAMAKAGFARQTDFIDEDLREAFFHAWDEERFGAPVDNKERGRETARNGGAT